jgi:hypothetical protein
LARPAVLPWRFTAENLRQATQLAGDRYPSSAVRIPFPIEPEDFFNAKHSRDADLEAPEGPEEHEGTL